MVNANYPRIFTLGATRCNVRCGTLERERQPELERERAPSQAPMVLLSSSPVVDEPVPPQESVVHMNGEMAMNISMHRLRINSELVNLPPESKAKWHNASLPSGVDRKVDLGVVFPETFGATGDVQILLKVSS